VWGCEELRELRELRKLRKLRELRKLEDKRELIAIGYKAQEISPKISFTPFVRGEQKPPFFKGSWGDQFLTE